MTNVKLKFDRVEREEAVFLCGIQDLRPYIWVDQSPQSIEFR